MTGAFLNALGILAGAIYGLAAGKPLPARAQFFFRTVLGTATVFFGARLVVMNLPGGLVMAARQLLLGIAAVVLGCWLGKLLRLQKLSNRAGRHAATLLAAGQKHPPGSPADGLLASTNLFCAAPLGILGAVADGLSGFFYLLLVKAVMDGLAMASFVKIFRWQVALTAIPVLVFFAGITFAVHHYARPWLDSHSLTAAVNVSVGLVACVVSLVIFEVRRVELNSYLPAIFIAPLLKLFLG